MTREPVTNATLYACKPGNLMILGDANVPSHQIELRDDSGRVLVRMLLPNLNTERT